MLAPMRLRTRLSCALLLCTSLCTLSLPARAAVPSQPQLACDWSFTATPLEVPAPGDARYVLADQNAGYWQAPFSSLYPLGTRLRLRGQFPAARNMSIQVTTSLIGFLTTIGSLTDYQLAPDPGSANPFVSVNAVDPAVAAGGHYTAYVQFGKAGSEKQPNTIYLDAAQYVWTGAVIVVYRIYAPFNGVLDQHGEVPLPQIELVAPDGSSTPIANARTPAQCAFWTAAEAAVVQGEADIGNALYAKPIAPWPIPPQPHLPAPKFVLWGGDDVLGQLPFTQWVVNADNAYVYATIEQARGDLVLVRARMPTHATQPDVQDPQLRYWSLCESSIQFLSTYQCIKDSDAVLDADGDFNAVISVPSKKPPHADAAHGYQWLTFGTTDPAAPIFRYMNPAPGFAQAPNRYDPAKDDSLSQRMGDYYPLLTYCTQSLFDARTQAGDSPAQVFAACQAQQ